MSATLHIYRVVDDVQELIFEHDEEFSQLGTEFLIGFKDSSGKEYKFEDSNYTYDFYPGNDGRNKRIRKTTDDLIDKNTLKYKIFNTAIGTIKIMVLEEVFYRQGWFLSKEFFNLSYTEVLIDNMADLKRLFDKYFNMQDKRYDMKTLKNDIFTKCSKYLDTGEYFFEISF